MVSKEKVRNLSFIAFAAINVSCLANEVNSPFEIEGLVANQIAVLSDGTVPAQAYLGDPITHSDSDVLTRFFPSGARIGSHFSNSVSGTPDVFAISRDGDLIVIVESFGPAWGQTKSMKDLEKGTRLFVRDLSDSRSGEFSLSFVPMAVDLNANGNWAVVGGYEANRGRIALVKLNRDGENKASSVIDQIYQYDISDLTGGNTLEPELTQVSQVLWHPKEDVFSVHLFRQDKLVFFRVDQDSNGVRPVPIGKPIDTPSDPFVGRFLDDGAYYVTGDWGRRFTAESIYDRLPEKSSISLFSLKLDENKIDHLQTIDVASSPEGMAVSPDGKRLAVVSMQKSLYWTKRPEEYSSKSVIAIYDLIQTKDGRDARLEEVDQAEFEGILPEGCAFDLSGRFVLTSVFQSDADAAFAHGWVKVFKIVARGNQTALTRAAKIKVPRGAHHVVVK